MGLTVTSPYTGEVVAELPWDEGEGLAQKVEAAARAQASWCSLPVEQRCFEVARALDYFRSHKESIARDVTRQMGKPIRESRGEVERMLDRAEYMLSIAPESLSPQALPFKPGFHRRIEHEPLGVVLDIAAWNYPLLIAVNVIVPALLAGNSVLVKHSARTPLCGSHFESAFASLPWPSLVTNLVMTHETTANLIGDSRINYVAFTGSVEGGRQIQQAASRRFIDVGLELGGKDPAYVAQDADLPFAVENIVDGACYNAGQSCCSVERVYVHRSLVNDFVARARPLLEQYRLGDPMQETTTMGPLADASALPLLEARVESAVEHGAKLLVGGKPSEGRFFAPTLLLGCSNDLEVMKEENFGPIVSVSVVETDEEALQRMNDSRYGLTASVWTKNHDRAQWFARRLNAGTIFQNRCDYLDPGLAWCGWKDSGKGVTLSRFGFLQLTRRKSLHFRN